MEATGNTAAHTASSRTSADSAPSQARAARTRSRVSFTMPPHSLRPSQKRSYEAFVRNTSKRRSARPIKLCKVLGIATRQPYLCASTTAADHSTRLHAAQDLAHHGAAGRTFLFHASADGRLRVYEYTGGTVNEIDAKQVGNIRAMVLSPDRNTLYMGVRDPALPPGGAFNQIYSLQLSNLTAAFNQLPAEELKFELGSSKTSPNECYDLDIDRTGVRLIAACHGELSDPNGIRHNLTEIDTTAGLWAVKNTLDLSAYIGGAGTLRIEPAIGSNFAYLTLVGATAADGILTLDLTGSGLKVLGQITGIVRGAIEFHPSGRFAYAFGPAGEIGRLDTDPSGMLPATAEIIVPFNAGASYKGAVVTANKFYTSELLGPDFSLVIRKLDGAGNFISNDSTKIIGVSERNSGLTEGLALAQNPLVPVTAKADPNTLEVSLNKLPPANSTTVLVPAGTQLPLDNVLPPNPPATPRAPPVTPSSTGPRTTTVRPPSGSLSQSLTPPLPSAATPTAPASTKNGTSPSTSPEPASAPTPPSTTSPSPAADSG